MYKIKIRREAAGLSQSQLAKKAGVSVRLIQTLEAESATNHRDINKTAALQVWKLAEALDCDIVDILELEAANAGA